MKVTSHFFNLIKKKNDAIWKQCIPSIEELQDKFNVDDPLQEERDTKAKFIIHRYPDRALLMASSQCAVYCRFCTRKRKVGRIKQIPLKSLLTAIRSYIGKHKEIRDVVVSGGDPLMRKDKEIEAILKELRKIPHIEVIRIGTRIPCVLPKRITKRFCNMLKKYHPVFMNIHFAHPLEITKEVEKACKILADAGIPLGSQTVLLKGINDKPSVMKDLMRKMLKMRIRPYYIYQCDLVKGVEHFRTDIDKGLEIMKKVQGHTSGLCLPHFVIDSPGGGKVPVHPEYMVAKDKDRVVIRNYLNERYEYPQPRK